MENICEGHFEKIGLELLVSNSQSKKIRRIDLVYELSQKEEKIKGLESQIQSEKETVLNKDQELIGC